MNATALVTTWRSRYGAHESVVHLTVSADGRRAEGRFTGLTRTATRSDPPPPPQDFATEGDVSTTTLTEAEFCRLEAEFAIGLRLRGCRQRPVERSRYGIHPVWFTGLDGDASWACVLFREDETLTTLVWQGGPRRLWDEAEAAYAWWAGRGEPAPERFGLTVAGDGGSRVWLDGPENVVAES